MTSTIVPAPASIDTEDFSKWCWNQTVRISTIIPMAAIGDGEECGDTLRDFFDDTDGETLGRIFGEQFEKFILANTDDFDDDCARREGILQWFIQHKFNGLLISVERPVFESRKVGRTFSWGYLHTQRLYVSSLAGIPAAVEAWVRKVDAADLAKKTKPSKAKREMTRLAID